MKPAFHRSATLTASVFMILLLSSSVFAFPASQTTEILQDNWTFWGDGHNYQYTSMVDFDYCSPDYFFGGVLIGNHDDVRDQLSWSHTLPSDLQVTPDDVLRAKLWIYAAYVGTDGNEVAIQGLANWDPLNNMFLDNSTYWLTDVDDQNFWNNGSISMSLAAGESYLQVDMATLMMDLNTDDDQSQAAAVPEPATVALMAVGLIGMAMLQRRRRNQAA